MESTPQNGRRSNAKSDKDLSMGAVVECAGNDAQGTRFFNS
jgi:hypothetical protein